MLGHLLFWSSQIIPTSGMEPLSPSSQFTGSEEDGQLPSQCRAARTGQSAQSILQAREFSDGQSCDSCREDRKRTSLFPRVLC